MNFRALLSPALYGGAAAAVVAAVGYAVAASQSLPLTMPAFVYAFGGLTAVALLAGTSSFNENAETPDVVASDDQTLSAPTEAGGPRRLLLLCFSLALALAGVVGVAVFA